MSLRSSLDKETVASDNSSEQQILDILKRCIDFLRKAKIDKDIFYTSLGTELQTFERYLEEDIDRETIVNEFFYIRDTLNDFIQQLANRNHDQENCRQLKELHGELCVFSKECLAKRTLEDIQKLFEQHTNAIERNIRIDLASFSGKEYQELRKYLSEHFDANIPEGENLQVASCLYSILSDREKAAAILDRFDQEDREVVSDPDLQYVELSSSLKTKIREIEKLMQYHVNLKNMLENLYSPKEKQVDDDTAIFEYAFMHPSEQIEKFSQELITKLNLLAPEYVKKLFIEDLQRYEQHLLRAAENKSSNSRFKGFFREKSLKSSLPVELSAIEKLKESLKGQDVEFTSLEIEALNRGALGALVEKYKQAGALPKDFFNRESFQKGPTRIMASTNTESS